jgi:hypothetical protein
MSIIYFTPIIGLIWTKISKPIRIGTLPIRCFNWAQGAWLWQVRLFHQTPSGYRCEIPILVLAGLWFCRTASAGENLWWHVAKMQMFIL